MYVCVVHAGAYGSQKRESDPMKTELQRDGGELPDGLGPKHNHLEEREALSTKFR